MKRMLGIIAAIVAVMVMALPLAACGNSSAGKSEDELKDVIAELTSKVDELTDKVDDLTTENGELKDKNEDISDRLDDLTTENGELKDKVNALNVFTSDKAEYEEHETMTIYFKNVPVLKLRIDFTNIYGTAVWSGSFNFSVFITALCADIYDESIIGTAFIAWDNGYCLRKAATPDLIKRNEETKAGGFFTDTLDAYKNGTWFDLIICVPGTPFELARFKNISYHFN